MDTVRESPVAYCRFWWTLFLLIAIGGATFAAVSKGFYLFSDERVEPLIQGADDTHYYLWLRSWVIDGDVSFSNDLMYTPFMDGNAKVQVMRKTPTDTGLVPNKYPVGWAVVNLPPFWLVYQWSQWSGAEFDGFEPRFQAAIWVWQLMIAALGMGTLYRLLQMWFPRSVGAAAGALGLATTASGGGGEAGSYPRWRR